MLASSNVNLLALDVALLLPPDVRQLAIRLSAALPIDPAHRLRLDDDRVPHVTLAQQFVRIAELEAVSDRIDRVVRVLPPLPLRITGAGATGSTVWLAIERSERLVGLHERLMDALRGVERPGGTAAAFFGRDARVADVLWVAGYRLASSFGAFTPHITLGHGDPPRVEPVDFEATTVAACHLGRFCTCRRALRVWTLRR